MSFSGCFIVRNVGKLGFGLGVGNNGNYNFEIFSGKVTKKSQHYAKIVAFLSLSSIILPKFCSHYSLNLTPIFQMVPTIKFARKRLPPELLYEIVLSTRRSEHGYLNICSASGRLKKYMLPRVLLWKKLPLRINCEAESLHLNIRLILEAFDGHKQETTRNLGAISQQIGAIAQETTRNLEAISQQVGAISQQIGAIAQETTRNLGAISQQISGIAQNMELTNKRLVDALHAIATSIKQQVEDKQKPAADMYESINFGQMASTSQGSQIAPPLPTSKMPDIPPQFRTEPKSKIPSIFSKRIPKGGPKDSVVKK